MYLLFAPLERFIYLNYPYPRLGYRTQNRRKLLPSPPPTAAILPPPDASTLEDHLFPQCPQVLHGSVEPLSSQLHPAVPTFVAAALHEGGAGLDG